MQADYSYQDGDNLGPQSFDQGNNSFTQSGAIFDSTMAGEMKTGATFASSFRNRSAAMTTDELRKARESRAAEALRMKDDQLRILTEQNANLLKTLDRVNFS